MDLHEFFFGPVLIGDLFHFWAMPYLCTMALGLGWASYEEFRHLFEEDDPFE